MARDKMGEGECGWRITIREEAGRNAFQVHPSQHTTSMKASQPHGFATITAMPLTSSGSVKRFMVAPPISPHTSSHPSHHNPLLDTPHTPHSPHLPPPRTP